MACRTCDHTMQLIHYSGSDVLSTFHCPNCGTVMQRYHGDGEERWTVPKIWSRPGVLFKRPMTEEERAKFEKVLEQARGMGYALLEADNKITYDHPIPSGFKGENGGDGPLPDLSFADIDLYGGLKLKAVSAADPKELARQCLERLGEPAGSKAINGPREAETITAADVGLLADLGLMPAEEARPILDAEAEGMPAVEVPIVPPKNINTDI